MGHYTCSPGCHFASDRRAITAHRGKCSAYQIYRRKLLARRPTKPGVEVISPTETLEQGREVVLESNGEDVQVSGIYCC
jgi:hypothetical protein